MVLGFFLLVLHFQFPRPLACAPLRPRPRRMASPSWSACAAPPPPTQPYSVARGAYRRWTSSPSPAVGLKRSRTRWTDAPNGAASQPSHHASDNDDKEWASIAGSGLESAGAEIAAAAAVLGENQVLTENPAALSMVGCGLANAGRALLEVSREEGWSQVGQRLFGAAGDLASSGAAVGPTSVAKAEDALAAAADALEDAGLAAETEGCGCGGGGGGAAAEGHLRTAGAAMRLAAGAVGDAAEEIREAAGRGSPSEAAARHLAAAARGLTDAAMGLTEALRRDEER